MQKKRLINVYSGTDTIQKENTERKKKRQNEHSISETWDHIKQPDMCAERREGTKYLMIMLTITACILNCAGGSSQCNQARNEIGT